MKKIIMKLNTSLLFRTWLTSVGSLSLNVSRVREQDWVRGWLRDHGSPSTSAIAELVT